MTEPMSATTTALPQKPWQAVFQRASAVLLQPSSTWAAVEQEDGDSVTGIYRRYLLWLAAIPALAAFIGQVLIGTHFMGITVRVPVLHALVAMVVSYALTLALLYVMGVLADALAPRFQGQRHALKAFQLIAYGATAGMLGGIFSLVPALSLLGLLAALYSIYLIYRGVPVLMRVPTERVLGYTAALIACGIGATLILSLASMLFVPRPAVPNIAGSSSAVPTGGKSVNIQVPGTQINIDTQRLEAASRKLEQAKASGDADAASKAMGEAMSAALGGMAKPLDPEQLRARVPERVAGLSRTGFEARSDGVMGIQLNTVRAVYGDGERQLELEIKDVGAVPTLLMGMAAWSNSTVERDDADSAERVYRDGGVAYRVSYRKDGSHAEQTMLLPNGLLVEARGRMGIDALRQALKDIPIGAMGAMKRPG